jgi:hypothetical protein
MYRDLNAEINILTIGRNRAGRARLHACGDGASTFSIREKRVASLNQELYLSNRALVQNSVT